MRAPLLAGCVIAMLAQSIAVRGSAPPDMDSDRALQLGHAALDLFGASQWAAAYQAFEAADRAAHSPVFVLYMARSKRNLGQLLDARSLFARVQKEEIPAGGPEAWSEARHRAADEQSALAGRIPSVAVVLWGIPCEAARIELDDEVVACAALAAPIELDPGVHRLVAMPDPSAAVARSFELAEGERGKPVELAFERPPARVAVPTVAAEPHSLALPMVAFGIGALGIGTGITALVLSREKIADIEGRCVNGHCPAADRPAYDEAIGLANHVATTGFLVGGLGVAAGVALLLSRPRAHHAGVRDGGWAVGVGPSSIVARGSF